MFRFYLQSSVGVPRNTSNRKRAPLAICTHTPHPQPACSHVRRDPSCLALGQTMKKKGPSGPSRCGAQASAVATVVVPGAGKRGPAGSAPVCDLKGPLGSLLSVHCSLDKDFLNPPRVSTCFVKRARVALSSGLCGYCPGPLQWERCHSDRRGGPACLSGKLYTG